MEKVLLKQLNMKSKDEAISFLKALWNQKSVNCPICGSRLELLHKISKEHMAATMTEAADSPF